MASEPSVSDSTLDLLRTVVASRIKGGQSSQDRFKVWARQMNSWRLAGFASESNMMGEIGRPQAKDVVSLVCGM